jgi:hypothetical protein
MQLASKRAVMARWDVFGRSARAGALMAAAVLCAAPAAAEVRITESGSGRVVVEAHDATVRQIIDALSTSHAIRFRASEALSRVVTGTYEGTLPRVLSRILDGYDHVIQSTPAGVRIDIVGAAKSTTSTASAANSVTVSAVPRLARKVSSNVDQDEESAVPNSAAAGPLTVNLAAGPHPSAPAARHAQRPGVPHVSSNLDLDEETSQ